MAFKVIVLSFLVAWVSYTHGAAIPNQLMNQVQDFLMNPEPLAAAMGMRVKRSTGDWDQEFDMEALGISFKLKYVDPAHPIKGGHVHMKFPARRFVKFASFDDVELEFDYKGGEAFDGLFEMKFDYKFIQKFTFFADRPQQGTVTMYRKKENGMYKTNIKLDSNAKKLFEIYFESDYKKHIVGKATFDHDNTWEMTVTRVPGKGITINFLKNGVGYTVVAFIDKAAWTANLKVSIPGKTFNLDVALNPSGKYGVHVTGDVNGPLELLMVLNVRFTEALINIKHRNHVYFDFFYMKRSSNSKQKFKYASTYTFMPGPGFAMQKQEGQVNIDFDGYTPKKVFIVDFTHTGGVQGKAHLTIQTMNLGFTYVFEITQGVQSYLKLEANQTVTADDANKWEGTDTIQTFMSQDSPIYEWTCKYMTCATTFEQTNKYFYDKQNKNYFLNKFSYESDSIYGGKKVLHLKIDTTKIPFILASKTFEGQYDLTLRPKNNFGFHMIYNFAHGGENHMHGDHDITVVNDGNKFEINELSNQTMDEHSMLYDMHCKLAYPLPCPKEIYVVQKVYVDKKNKNALFNKMTYDTEVKLDGQVYKTIKLDTVNTPYQLTWNEPKTPFWMPSPMNMFGLPMWTVTVDHKIGHELVMKSNLADMKITIRRQPKIFIEFIKHQETHFLLDTKINGNVINADLKTMLYIPSGSIFCPRRSTYVGCYNKWDGEFKVHVDRQSKNVYLNKFSINADIKKANEVQFEYEMNTMVTPYVMKMKSPCILPMVFDDPRRHTFEATVEHKEGDMLHIITNAPEMSNFKVTTDGAQRVLELNGEQLVVVDYTKADKKFKQVLQLPNGEHVTITLDWATWNPKNNKVNLHIETPTRKFNVNTDYDITNIKAGKMMVKFHGENPLLGKFEIMRNGNWKVAANQIDAKWNGKAIFAKGPLAMFSPIDTVSTVNYNFPKMILNADIAKTIAGQKWGVKVSQNKINLYTGQP